MGVFDTLVHPNITYTRLEQSEKIGCLGWSTHVERCLTANCMVRTWACGLVQWATLGAVCLFRFPALCRSVRATLNRHKQSSNRVPLMESFPLQRTDARRMCAPWKTCSATRLMGSSRATT